MTTTDVRPITGPELRSIRVNAGIPLVAVARRYGVARQRIQELERRTEVPLTSAKRYRDALDAAVEDVAE